ncbi:hypothetical protein QBC36DRAFT_358695 [Triangularia setosa]|uniref:Uncharacterized protein n=1 Tax=Triangularia setosa TaxID=2587417 RepID=A0AAN7A5F8_9PEZI|nr:hypothetical protein QBC36DRAFT_358695 [Podospora setosa]
MERVKEPSGFNFNGDGNQTNKTRIAEKGLGTTSQDTFSVAAYWPWIVHGDQQSNRNNQPPNKKWIVKLAEAHNQMHSNYVPGTDWTIRNLTIEVKFTTKMSTVPLSADFKKSSNSDYEKEPGNRCVMFYHGSDNRLKFSHQSLDTARWDGYYLPDLFRPPATASINDALIQIPSAATNNRVRPARVIVMATIMLTPEPNGYSTGQLARNGVNVGVAYINQNHQFALLFTITGGILRTSGRAVNTGQVNKLAPPDLFTDIARITMASGAANENGEEIFLPLDQDDEGTIATCLYCHGKGR